jgi:nitronate monooxygenase
MASAATPALAAAVARAGALGSLGTSMLAPAASEEQVAELRRASDRPFNLNFFANTPASSDPAKHEVARRLVEPFYAELGLGPVPNPGDVSTHFDETMLETVLRLRPEVVSFHFGLPQPAMVDALHDIGCVVLSSATTVREALLLEERDADAIVAQGWEAGGHRGTFASPFAHAQVGTFALVPQIADAVSVPVIAAGGIADGRGIAAAFALGASGVQLGTAFLRCPETAITDPHRDELAAAGADATEMTYAFTGRPARSIRNRYVEQMTEELARSGETLPEFPLMLRYSGPLRSASAERGIPDFMPLWAGQGAALGMELPAGELVEKLVADAHALLGKT